MQIDIYLISSVARVGAAAAAAPNYKSCQNRMNKWCGRRGEELK